MVKKSFLVYYDTYDMVSMLSDEETGRLFKALFDYGLNGTIPNFDGSLLMCFTFMAKQLTRDTEKYKQLCEKRQEVARERWERYNSLVG